MGYPTTRIDPVMDILAGIEKFWGLNYQGSPLESRFTREMGDLRSAYEGRNKRRAVRLAHSWYAHFLGESDLADLSTTIGNSYEMKTRFQLLEREISGRRQ